MTVNKSVAYLVVIAGLVGLLVVNIMSQRSLDEARADRGDLERQLQTTIQKQTEAQIGLSGALQLAQGRIGELERRSEKLDDLVQQLTKERDQLTKERDQLTDSRGTITDELKALRASLSAKQIDGRKLDETLSGVKALLDEVQSKVTSSEQALLARLAELERISNENRPPPAPTVAPAATVVAPAATVVAPAATVVAPAVVIDALVAAVSATDGVVVLGVGTTKGVVEGTVFSIYRDTERVATVRAVNVHRDYAGCVIDSVAEPIRKGYRASTK